MTDARPFRFGVNLLDIGDRAAWREKCRKAERLGYDVILVPDHIGFPAPFPALVAAGEGTTRPRLGTFVLNAGFYNPTLLARDVAATDQLTEGRLELGLGAGYVKAEFDTAGLPFGTGGERLAHLRATVERLRELLEDPEHRPAAAQARVPLLLGGNGDRILRLAARHAEIVGFTGAVDDGVGNLSLIPPDALAERVAFAREAAGPGRRDRVERPGADRGAHRRPGRRDRAMVRAGSVPGRRPAPRAANRVVRLAGADRRGAGRPPRALRVQLRHRARRVDGGLRRGDRAGPRLVLKPRSRAGVMAATAVLVAPSHCRSTVFLHHEDVSGWRQDLWVVAPRECQRK